jgi:hypothetical protein
MLQSPLRPTTAVLLSQGVLWLLAGTVIAVTRWWEHKPWFWLGLRPISWRAALLACVFGVMLVFAAPALTVAGKRLVPPSDGGTVESVATSAPAWLPDHGADSQCDRRAALPGIPDRASDAPHGKRWPGALLSVAAFVAIHAGVEPGPRPWRRAALGRRHDRPLSVAAQSSFHVHYPFCT